MLLSNNVAGRCGSLRVAVNAIRHLSMTAAPLVAFITPEVVCYNFCRSVIRTALRLIHPCRRPKPPIEQSHVYLYCQGEERIAEKMSIPRCMGLHGAH